MTSTAKDDLRRYLQEARDALLWKTEGLSEYDLRRPMTPTGTNLLGLVKHSAAVELGYFGVTFNRPSAEPQPWDADGAESNDDMWATADESKADIVALYRRTWEHADATIAALDLDAVGRVPWWTTNGGQATLHLILVHVIAETNRHAGHADILRELIDNTAGHSEGNGNLPPEDGAWWVAYRERLEEVARQVKTR